MQPSRLHRARQKRPMLVALGLLLLVSLTACAEPAATMSVGVLVQAGPVCPVVTDPPDPTCADRPVQGAELVVVDPNARRITSVRTDSAGRTSISLPAGTYTIRPQPVPSLMGTPAEVLLVLDHSTPDLIIGYDTGIR